MCETSLKATVEIYSATSTAETFIRIVREIIRR